MKIKKSISLLSILGSLLLAQDAFAATAGTTPAEVTIQGGSLGITVPTSTVDFGTVLIDGTVQTLNADLGNVTIQDFTGTGNGWNVTLGASQFTSGAKTLPLSSLAFRGISTITPNGTSSPLPNIVGSAPYTLDGGSTVKILAAGVDKGMGQYTVGFASNALGLTVDTNLVKATGTPYTSTLTWTIVSAP